MSKKYQIIGQGIAGTVLSMRMIDAGIDHSVIDDPSLSSCSKVAAGLINPIVLKRLKKVENADNYLDSAIEFYRSWENKLNSTLIREVPVHHIFSSYGEQNLWIEKSENASYQKYLQHVISVNNSEQIDAPFGYGVLGSTYWLDFTELLQKYRQYLSEVGRYIQMKVEAEDLNIMLKNQGTDSIVLANGHLLRVLFPITSQLFAPTKGELLIIESKDLPQDKIIHSGVFILPLGSNRFRVGATYQWNELNDKTTKSGKDELEEKLSKFFKGRYTVIDHQAGVRPNTRDRKPLLGSYNDFYIFNGLGSRGALMAPYLAERMLDFTERKKNIPAQYDISRFKEIN